MQRAFAHGETIARRPRDGTRQWFGRGRSVGPAASVRTETQTAGEAHLLRIKSEEKAMPTYELIAPRAYTTWRPRNRIPPLAAAFVLIKRWIERMRQRRALGSLDDAMLRDIGITRVDAARECEKPFWK
jgi:uncharacterized protein YjiS (DUF1127 family)